MQHRSRSLSTAIVIVLGTALALLAGPGLGEAHAVHPKIGPYELPSAKVQCTYSGRVLQKVTVPPAEVSMDKALYRAGRKSQYVGIAVTLQGEKGGAWHGVAKHGGTGHRKVAYSVKTHVREYKQIPSATKRSMLTFTDPSVLRGYSHYRVRMQLFWYAANGRKIRGKVSRILPAYSTGTSCLAQTAAPVVAGHPQISFPGPGVQSLPVLNGTTATLAGVNGSIAGTLSLYRSNSAVPCTQMTKVWDYAATVGNGPWQLQSPGGAWSTPGYYTWGFSAPANRTNAAMPLACSGIIRGEYSVGAIALTAADGSVSKDTFKVGHQFPIRISFPSRSGSDFSDGHSYTVTVGMYTGATWADIHCGPGQLVKTHTVTVSSLAATPTVDFTIDSSANTGRFQFMATWGAHGGPQTDVPNSTCALGRIWK